MTWYLALFLAFYTIVKFNVPAYELKGAALTLFSVNSFLYGFYIAPILAGQKTRIEELHKSIRSEANALFSMLLDTQNLNETTKRHMQDAFIKYARSSVREKGVAQGEDEYEAIITYCVKYKGKDKAEVKKILDKLVANQTNRTQFNMQYRSAVYSNE